MVNAEETLKFLDDCDAFRLAMFRKYPLVGSWCTEINIANAMIMHYNTRNKGSDRAKLIFEKKVIA